METSSANALAAKQDQAAARRRRLLGAQLARSAARRCRTLAARVPRLDPAWLRRRPSEQFRALSCQAEDPLAAFRPGTAHRYPSTRQGRACARLSVITQVGFASTSPEHLLAHFGQERRSRILRLDLRHHGKPPRNSGDKPGAFQRAASRPRRSTPQRIETSSQNTRRGTPRRGPAVTPLRRASRPRRPGRRADPGWQAS